VSSSRGPQDSPNQNPADDLRYVRPSGLVLPASSWLFLHSRLGVYSQVAWWAAKFFFASCAASCAYLTVSEVFPQGVRASSIALFYSFGTLAGGAFGPLIFGHLIGATGGLDVS